MALAGRLAGAPERLRSEMVFRTPAASVHSPFPSCAETTWPADKFRRCGFAIVVCGGHSSGGHSSGGTSIGANAQRAFAVARQGPRTRARIAVSVAVEVAVSLTLEIASALQTIATSVTVTKPQVATAVQIVGAPIAQVAAPIPPVALAIKTLATERAAAAIPFSLEITFTPEITLAIDIQIGIEVEIGVRGAPIAADDVAIALQVGVARTAAQVHAAQSRWQAPPAPLRLWTAVVALPPVRAQANQPQAGTSRRSLARGHRARPTASAPRQ